MLATAAEVCHSCCLLPICCLATCMHRQAAHNQTSKKSELLKLYPSSLPIMYLMPWCRIASRSLLKPVHACLRRECGFQSVPEAISNMAIRGVHSQCLPSTLEKQVQSVRCQAGITTRPAALAAEYLLLQSEGRQTPSTSTPACSAPRKRAISIMPSLHLTAGLAPDTTYL